MNDLCAAPARFAQSGADETSSYQFLRAVLLFPQVRCTELSTDAALTQSKSSPDWKLFVHDTLQDLLYGGMPSYAVSNHAFIPDSNHPILVRLSTKVRHQPSLPMDVCTVLLRMPADDNCSSHAWRRKCACACSAERYVCAQRPTDFVPSIGLRFDYAQMGTDPSGNPVTPQVSVLYTDLVSSYPVGLPGTSPSSGSPQINLVQSFDWQPDAGEDAMLSDSSV